MDFKIIPAVKENASDIAAAIIAAVGPEITLGFAGAEARIPLVTKTFTLLAESENSQYSYKNSLVAVSPEREVAGVIVSYDGARLHSLRKEFISVANRILGKNFNDADFEDETSPDEVYLDSLCVFPKFRRNGIASRLIFAACKSHIGLGKPFGLLVDPDNPDAHKLYERLGFREVGMRPFAGVMMHRMQLPVSELAWQGI